MTREKVVTLIVSVLAALAVLVVVGGWWFQNRSLPVFFTESAVQVLALEAGRMFQSNPATSAEELDRMIKAQHEASNINLKVDSNGKAVDPFGMAFQVENRIAGNQSITTVTSAGPDREFGTGDDISYTHEQEIP